MRRASFLCYFVTLHDQGRSQRDLSHLPCVGGEDREIDVETMSGINKQVTLQLLLTSHNSIQGAASHYTAEDAYGAVRSMGLWKAAMCRRQRVMFIVLRPPTPVRDVTWEPNGRSLHVGRSTREERTKHAVCATEQIYSVFFLEHCGRPYKFFVTLQQILHNYNICIIAVNPIYFLVSQQSILHILAVNLHFLVSLP